MDWLFYIGGFPFIACIASLPPMLLLLLIEFHVKTPSGQVPFPARMAALAFPLVFGSCVSFWLINRCVNRQYWRLTDSELIGGIRRQIRLPLASIEKVIVGLPARSVMALRGNALLLVFTDGRLLPLKLELMPNGTELMRQLAERLKDRIVHNYSYSPEEIKLLRQADPNALIRKK